VNRAEGSGDTQSQRDETHGNDPNDRRRDSHDSNDGHDGHDSRDRNDRGGRRVGLKVNVGCGASPTPGFVNLDNSWSARVAKIPFLAGVLAALPLLGEEQRAFIARARALGIGWADAAKLPFEDGTVGLVYTSHMLEHLTQAEAAAFFREALRVLEPGGWIRIAVPDLRRIAVHYVDGALDADGFVEATLMASARPRNLRERITLAVTGPRHHLWMYDGPSLCRLLRAQGFVNEAELPRGLTKVPDTGALNLLERADESVYVEGQKAGAP
jgi:SAM-dependent methyltransferase